MLVFYIYALIICSIKDIERVIISAIFIMYIVLVHLYSTKIRIIVRGGRISNMKITPKNIIPIQTITHHPLIIVYFLAVTVDKIDYRQLYQLQIFQFFLSIEVNSHFSTKPITFLTTILVYDILLSLTNLWKILTIACNLVVLVYYILQFLILI